MKEKEQQIEEMAKIQCDSCKKYTGESENCNSKECLFLRKKYANELYEQGYRKISQNERIFCPTADTKMVLLTREELERVKEQARKETAEKIWKEIAKKFGVEVKE